MDSFWHFWSSGLAALLVWAWISIISGFGYCIYYRQYPSLQILGDHFTRSSWWRWSLCLLVGLLVHLYQDGWLIPGIGLNTMDVFPTLMGIDGPLGNPSLEVVVAVLFGALLAFVVYLVLTAVENIVEKRKNDSEMVSIKIQVREVRTRSDVFSPEGYSVKTFGEPDLQGDSQSEVCDVPED